MKVGVSTAMHQTGSYDKLEVELMSAEAKLPVRASKDAVGYDVFAVLDKEKDQVHFGYFYSNAETVKDLTYPYPFEYYDYTNPFTHVAYLDYKVELKFHDIGYNETTLKPAYVICDVTILNSEDEPVYTRSAALCF